jgi:SOS-response transcriptional repressor LexA
MHDLQQKLLKLAQDRNLGQFTLRETARMVGENSPQKIKHHLSQLEKRGLIRVDRARNLIEKIQPGSVTGLLQRGRLLTIPILGSANAGPARLFAEQNVEGYLKISSTLIRRRRSSQLFALKVEGPSMNRSVIEGKRIEDGDYVIVDGDARDPKDRDVVLFVIDGLANLKRFYRDKQNRQIALVSESTQDFPPIYIHEDDDFLVNGKVIQVIKKPKRGGQ